MPDPPGSRLIPGGASLPRAFAAPAAGGRNRPDPEAAAYERGKREGRAEALAEVETRTAELADELGHALKGLCDLQEQLTREHKSLMVELALEAASRIVRERIEAGDPVAARALERAIEALPSGIPLEARLHPDDLEAVETRLAETLERRQLKLAADAAIQRGGCVVESAAGTIDATIETAMTAVRAAAEGWPEGP